MNSQKSKPASAGKSSNPKAAAKTTRSSKGGKPARARKPAAPRTRKPTKKTGAGDRVPQPHRTDFPPLLKKLVRALDDKKAERLVVLNVSRLSSITDYLVVGTATSEPHLRALRVELEKVIDAEQTKILGIDTGLASGWTVVDAFDVMVHLFTPENRDKYRLENLWKDAEEIPVSTL